MMMSGGYLCPVCGYPDLDEWPWDGASGSDEICSSCGTHFGYHDAAGGDAARREAVYVRLRLAWKSAGCPWFAPGRPPPGWNPAEQLEAVED